MSSAPYIHVRPAWYAHDDHPDPPDFTLKNRRFQNLDPEAKHIHTRLRQNNTMDWYKHDHGPNDEYVGWKGKASTAAATGVKQKLRPGGKANWFEHPEEPENVNVKSVPRLTDRNAGAYMEKNVKGSSKTWFTHEEVTPLPKPPIKASAEGTGYAQKSRDTSEKWFVIDPPNNPPPKASEHKINSTLGKELIEKSVKGNIGKVFQEEENKDYKIVMPTPRVTKQGRYILYLQLRAG